MSKKFNTVVALGASVLLAASAFAGQAKPAAKPAAPRPSPLRLRPPRSSFRPSAAKRR